MEKKSVYDVLRGLENVDFIEKLRETAEREEMPLYMVRVLLDEAAKRIEDMEELIAIMSEPEEDDGVNDRCWECSCWHENDYGKERCWGTKEREACDCGGDKRKCNFYLYPEKGT